jgi:hypothetical protein
MRRIALVTLVCAVVALFGWMMVGGVQADEKAPTPPATPAPGAEPAPTAPKAEAKVLFDFEDDKGLAQAEAKNAETSLSTDHATSGKNSLKVVLSASKLPGVGFMKLPVTDWSGYKTLKFDIFAEGDDAMKFAMSIKDTKSKDYASRYNNEKIAVAKGANTISIDIADIGGHIDLKIVKQMSIFACGTLEKEATVYIDNIRLEK